MIATVVANYSGKLKFPKKPDDFMLKHPEHRRRDDTNRTLAMLDTMAKKKDGE